MFNYLIIFNYSIFENQILGISSETIHFDESISESHLCQAINKLNQDPDVDGILVQLPLPPHMDERKICNLVAPEKDVDGFHIVNVGRLVHCSVFAFVFSYVFSAKYFKMF